MITILLLLCTVLAILQMAAEVIYERDWPRETCKAFFLCLMFMAIFAGL